MRLELKWGPGALTCECVEVEEPLPPPPQGLGFTEGTLLAEFKQGQWITGTEMNRRFGFDTCATLRMLVLKKHLKRKRAANWHTFEYSLNEVPRSLSADGPIINQLNRVSIHEPVRIGSASQPHGGPLLAACEGTRE